MWLKRIAFKLKSALMLNDSHHSQVHRETCLWCWGGFHCTRFCMTCSLLSFLSFWPLVSSVSPLPDTHPSVFFHFQTSVLLLHIYIHIIMLSYQLLLLLLPIWCCLFPPFKHCSDIKTPHLIYLLTFGVLFIILSITASCSLSLCPFPPTQTHTDMIPVQTSTFNVLDSLTNKHSFFPLVIVPHHPSILLLIKSQTTWLLLPLLPPSCFLYSSQTTVQFV